jgi:nitroreductase
MLDLIRKRRSVYPQDFTGEEIPKSDIEEMLDTARFAPTHRKTQPWRFKVVTGSVKNEFGQFMADALNASKGVEGSFKSKKLQQKFEQSAAVILLFMHRDEKESVPEWEEVAATSMSVHNLWLSATSMGYGGYWSSPKSFADLSEFKPLHIHEREQSLGFFFLGVPKVKQPADLPERKPLDEVVQWVG